MAGESQQVPAGAPDPTVLTTEALGRGLDAERDYTNAQLAIRDERFRGIDTATRLLNETVNRVPTDVQKEVSHLRELAFERIESSHRELRSLAVSIELQFKERDTRSERESRDNKVAVDAAFAAQKEAASEQNKSNTLAIDKSEKATAETLNKQADLFKSTTDSLSGQISDVKDQLASLALDLKQTRAGNEAGTAGKSASYANLIALLGALGVIVGIVSVMVRLN